MATVTVKSTGITNRDADPQVFNNSYTQNAQVKETVATLEIGTGDDIGSKYLLGSIPSGARMSDILISSDDMGTATAADIGLYQTTKNGSAVVDADFFASALSLSGGALIHSANMHESGVLGVEDIEKRIWEALGLTADPFVDYDVAATLTAAADTGGTLSMQIRFVI